MKNVMRSRTMGSKVPDAKAWKFYYFFIQLFIWFQWWTWWQLEFGHNLSLVAGVDVELKFDATCIASLV